MTDAATEKPKKLCFVVGPIGEAGSETRRHADWLLKGIVKPALERSDYDVKRADEDVKPGMINDGIIHDILNAELVVADLTELNPNAFYELGIRHSREKPTIHIARKGTKLPFDNIGHACIFIDVFDVDDVRIKIEAVHNSAKEIEREGFRVSNPITQANAGFKMKESADPKDQVIAQLMERVGRLEQRDMMSPTDKREDAVINEIVSLVTSRELDEKRVTRLSNKAYSYWRKSNGTLTAKDAIMMAYDEMNVDKYRNNALAIDDIYPVRNALLDIGDSSKRS